MIIGLSGRIKSGKSSLANYLVKEHDFKKITMASFLKDSVASLYGIDVNNFYDEHLKSKKRNDLHWDMSLALKYSKLHGLDFNKLYFGNIDDRKFEDARDCLTYLGTNILRRYDENFHVKKVLQQMTDPDLNYVCDDVRFQNEKSLFEKNGGKCLFIIRPHNFEYINHSSETSLTCKDFDNFIINNETYADFIDEAQNVIFNNKINKSNVDNTKFIFKNIEDAFWAGFINGSSALEFNEDTKKYKLVISSSKNKTIQDFCKFIGLELEMYMLEDKYAVELDDPFILENLKLWDIR